MPVSPHLLLAFAYSFIPPPALPPPPKINSFAIQYDSHGAPGTTVPTGDLDLSSPDGKATLRRRLNAAIESLCGLHGERSLGIVSEQQACRRNLNKQAAEIVEPLLASARPALGDPEAARIAFSPCTLEKGRIETCTVVMAAASAALTSRPDRRAKQVLAPGLTVLGDVGFAYRPPSSRGGARPLLLFLHGAGGSARETVEALRPLADRHDVIVAAVQSNGATWDLAEALKTSTDNGRSRTMPDFGADAPRIDGLLRTLFVNQPIDPDAVVLAGFSDGAAYALSLGLANPALFGGLLAIAPGFVKMPERIDPAQRVIIVHGMGDTVIPVEQGRTITRTLSDAGIAANLALVDGGHAVDATLLEREFERLLGPPKT